MGSLVHSEQVQRRDAVRIIVDADACPVKREIIETSRPFPVEVMFIASHDHLLLGEDGVTVVQVDRADQSVDLYIANRLRQRDILITQDFGLATIGLAKQAVVLSFRGQAYTDRTIDFLMARRHELAKRRRAGGKTKGPKPFTDQDRKAFQQQLTKVLHDVAGN